VSEPIRMDGQVEFSRRAVDDFNANFPVGAEVILLKDSGPFRTTVRSTAFLFMGRYPMAFFAGVSGCYSLTDGSKTRVLPVASPPEEKQ
jgi:hypothetical protein